MRRFAALLLSGTFLAGLAPAPGLAADVFYNVTVDGRALDAKHHSGLDHDGTLYINVVRAVKALDGLLTFGQHGAVRVSVNGRTLRYQLGRSTALVDNGATIKFRGSPFVSNGDTYVPLVSMATLAGARYSVDARNHVVNLALGRSAGFAPPPTLPPDQPEEEADLSPLQALTIKASATADASGLHARADISNTTAKAYALSFPGPAQFVFVITRNGSEVWTSQPSAPGGGPSTFRLESGATTAVTADWPGFLKAGAGRYNMRVRLMRPIPIDAPPVSLDAIAPAAPASP